MLRRRRHELPAKLRASEPGIAPADGRPVEAEDGSVVGWRVDCGGRRARERWRSAAERFGDSGLWPVLIQRGEHQPEFLGPAPLRRPDPGAVLRALWADGLPQTREELEDMADVLAPFGAEFPGLGRGGNRREHAAPEAAMRLMDGFAGVLLVPVTRPADVVGATGWTGPVNVTDDAAALSAVLRSWEDHYDAFVVGISLDRLFLAVRRPPRGRDAALQLAAEQRAFCADVVDQGFGSIRALAAALDGAAAWSFWWD